MNNTPRDRNTRQICHKCGYHGFLGKCECEPVDDVKKVLDSDQEVYAAAVEISKLLVGLSIGQARHVLQTCGDIVCSTVWIKPEDVVAVDAEFRGAYEQSTEQPQK